MGFKEELGERIRYAEGIIRSYLPDEVGYQKTILEAMNYAVLVGGKRLRPVIINECYRMLGGEGNVHEPFMAAIEFLHTASLVHDDLPCMDNDEYRRGKKTVHAVYGEAVGVLTGDSLLNFTYETACRAFSIGDASKVSKALSVLATKAGVHGMMGGQMVDLESEGKEVDHKTLEFIHTNKTAALIEASMHIGAILAGASEDDLILLSRVALDIGFAFQIQDDVLDVIGDAKVLGKPVGSDEELKKTTYVSVFGLEKAKSDVEFYSNRAINSLKIYGDKASFLISLIKMLITREK